MRTLFKSYYPLSEKDLASLWSDCFFAVDANVLLNLYRFPKDARQDLLGVLRIYSDRLWLPHQAALEYQRNRTSVLWKQQVEQFKSVLDLLTKLESDLKGGLHRLDLKNRHPTINPDKLVDKISSVIAASRSDLTKLQSEQEIELKSIDDDICELFEGRVGEPLDSADLDKLQKDGAVRYQHKLPPGYSDSAKVDVFYHQGLPIQSRYGDLILWKQLLRKAEREKAKRVILVTDDDKEDWWLRAHGQTVGPRRELVEEIGAAGVELFHIYNSDRFMEYAQSQPKVTILPGSIAQIKETRGSVSKARFADDSDISRLNAIENHLKRTFPGSDVVVSFGGRADFVVRSNDRTYGVIAVPRPSIAAILNLGARAVDLLKSRLFDHVFLVVSSTSPRRIREIRMSPPVREIAAVVTVMLLLLTEIRGGYSVKKSHTIPAGTEGGISDDV